MRALCYIVLVVILAAGITEMQHCVLLCRQSVNARIDYSGCIITAESVLWRSGDGVEVLTAVLHLSITERRHAAEQWVSTIQRTKSEWRD